MASLDVPAERVRRITAVLLGRIGDVIVATPFLRSLRGLYPKATLRLALSSACAGLRPLLAPGGAPIAPEDLALVYPWHRAPLNLGAAWFIGGRRSELVVDLNPAPSKSAAALMALARAPVKLGFSKGRFDAVYTHQVAAPLDDEPMLDRYARLAAELGAEYSPGLSLSVGDSHRQDARELLRRLDYSEARVNVAIHPGNFKKFDNRWPEKNFIALTDRLLDDPALSLYYMAGPGERPQVEAIVRALKRPVPILPQAPLSATAAMLTRMRALICNITGTTHLATAVGVPTFGFYSGYTHAVWRPRDARCGGVVSPAWESCRDIGVENAHQQLSRFLAQLPVPSP